LDGPALRPGGITPKIDANGVVTFWDGVGQYRITAQSAQVASCFARMDLVVGELALVAGSDLESECCLHEPRGLCEPPILLVPRRSTTEPDPIERREDFYGRFSKIVLDVALLGASSDGLPPPRWRRLAGPSAPGAGFEGESGNANEAPSDTRAVYAGDSGLAPGKYIFEAEWCGCRRQISLHVVDIVIEEIPRFFFANAGGDLPVRVRFEGIAEAGTGKAVIDDSYSALLGRDIRLQTFYTDDVTVQRIPKEDETRRFVAGRLFAAGSDGNGTSDVYTFLFDILEFRGTCFRRASDYVRLGATDKTRAQVDICFHLENAEGVRVTNIITAKSCPYKDADNRSFVFFSDAVRCMDIDNGPPDNSRPFMTFTSDLVKRPEDIPAYIAVGYDERSRWKQPTSGFCHPEQGDFAYAECEDVADGKRVRLRAGLGDGVGAQLQVNWIAEVAPYERVGYAGVSYGVIACKLAPSGRVIDTTTDMSRWNCKVNMQRGRALAEYRVASSLTEGSTESYESLKLSTTSLLLSGLGAIVKKNIPLLTAASIVVDGMGVWNSLLGLGSEIPFCDKCVGVSVKTWVTSVPYDELTKTPVPTFVHSATLTGGINTGWINPCILEKALFVKAGGTVGAGILAGLHVQCTSAPNDRSVRIEAEEQFTNPDEVRLTWCGL
ncbi:MAG: hypothetical protein JXR37_01325, partial [Kiritimatiellae bacterium]|nr:hypothetical protein [Kiritimatiellia bacterium]